MSLVAGAAPRSIGRSRRPIRRSGAITSFGAYLFGAVRSLPAGDGPNVVVSYPFEQS